MRILLLLEEAETMLILKPPTPCKEKDDKQSVFLAGSIEMGKADDWQAKIERVLTPFEGRIYNPRRDDWDSSWEQVAENKQFAEQVNWELDHLEKADLIFLYFDPETKAPISLLELGLHVGRKEMIVVCPDGFYRKGNVEIVCKRNKVKVYNTLDEGIKKLLEYFR
jgi:hypothetical protein